MIYKLLHSGEQKSFALILDDGEEVSECLLKFARRTKLKAAQFSAIGAFSEVETGFFSFETRNYKRNLIREQVEVLALNGDVSLYQGQPKIHAHIVLGKEDGKAYGGHLMQGIVHPTLEVIITESPAFLEREMDEKTGIPLIHIREENTTDNLSSMGKK